MWFSFAFFWWLVSSLKNGLFSSTISFHQIVFCCLFCQLYEFFAYFGILTPYQVIWWFANIFCFSVGFLFIQLMVSFAVQNVFTRSWLSYHLLIFCFSWLWLSNARNHSQDWCEGLLFPCFHLEFYGFRSSLHILNPFPCAWSKTMIQFVAITFSQHDIKKIVLSNCIFLTSRIYNPLHYLTSSNVN